MENLPKKTLKSNRERSVVEAKKRKVFQGRGEGQLTPASQSNTIKGTGDLNQEQSVWDCGATEMGLREKLEGKQGEITACLCTSLC